MRSSWPWLLSASAAFAPLVNAESNLTEKHEAGRCAIRGNCGKQGFFGSDLPCPDNGLAEDPSAAVRKRLVDLCGDKWDDGKVCCKEEQVSKAF